MVYLFCKSRGRAGRGLSYLESRIKGSTDLHALVSICKFFSCKFFFTCYQKHTETRELILELFLF